MQTPTPVPFPTSLIEALTSMLASNKVPRVAEIPSDILPIFAADIIDWFNLLAALTDKEEDETSHSVRIQATCALTMIRIIRGEMIRRNALVAMTHGRLPMSPTDTSLPPDFVRALSMTSKQALTSLQDPKKNLFSFFIMGQELMNKATACEDPADAFPFAMSLVLLHQEIQRRSRIAAAPHN